MRTVRSRGMLLAAAATAALGLVISDTAGASVHGAATAATPPQVIRAVLITRSPQTLAPGTRIAPRDIAGQRVFTSARNGFALASVRQADYAVATTDGGKTWKTDSPALHLHAAQAPLAVVFIGAVNRRTVFAWGGGQVIDATSDGGRHWYRALFTVGNPVGVVQGISGHLLAFVGAFTGRTIWQYVSRDGGRTWRYQTRVAQ